MALNIVSSPSANYGERSPGPIDMLVIHYTGMWTAEDALARLRDPGAKVSAHYMIDEDGTVHALVAEDKRAWHAGLSYWAGTTDVNSRSIGIELVNKGHDLGYHDFARAQMAALIELGRAILARHPIPAYRVVGHSDVAPTRKLDPGEKFDWARLAAAGIGLYPPEGVPKPKEKPDRTRFLAKLARFGYAVGGEAGRDGAGAGAAIPGEPGAAAIEAWRRHYHDHALGNPLGIGDAGRLDWLIARLPPEA